LVFGRFICGFGALRYKLLVLGGNGSVKTVMWKKM